MRYLIIIFSFCTLPVFSQGGGETIYNFLNISSSARQIALGGNQVTILGNVNSSMWNPALINNEIDNQLGVNYSNYISNVSLTSISFAHMVNRNFGTLQANINYLNYGKLIAADELGNVTGTFNAFDLAFSVGYAREIDNSDIYIGGSVKFVNSVIENYSSFGIGADLGLLYYNEYNPLVIGLVIRNIGYQVSVFNEDRENFPLNISLGISYQLENVPLVWYATIDNLQKWQLAYSNPSNQVIDLNGNITKEKISILDNAFRHITIGAELFPKGAFNLRFGYNFRRAKELQLLDRRTFAGLSAGFGLKMNKFKLNYAFSKIHPSTNTNTFSLILNFN
ncbi:MAG: type IX secretion system protein PorQ [Lutibacter sp.]